MIKIPFKLKLKKTFKDTSFCLFLFTNTVETSISFATSKCFILQNSCKFHLWLEPKFRLVSKNPTSFKITITKTEKPIYLILEKTTYHLVQIPWDRSTLQHMK